MMIVDKELDRYLVKNSAPKCLLLSTSSIDYYYEHYFWQNYLGTNLYDMNEIQEFYRQSEGKNVFPSSQYPKWQFLLKSMAFRYFYFSPYKKMRFMSSLGISSDEEAKYHFTRKEIESHRGFTGYQPGKSSEAFVSWRHAYLFKPFQPIPTDDFYFTRILEKAQQKKIKIFYFEVPLFQSNDTKISQFHQNHLKHIASLINPYPIAKIVTSHLKLDRSYYRDISHFNTKGAALFSEELKKSVEKECVL